LGLGSPIIIRLKVAMREMYKRKMTWDEQLPSDLDKHFKMLIRVVVDAGGLEFRRCTKPEDAVGFSVMVVFFDGSDQAFSAVVYMRWKVSSGGYRSFLLVAKAKVSAMWSTSTPRVEMDGAVLATRPAYRALKQTWNTSRARERSSRKICLRLWKKMWNSLNSSCGRQFLEGFPHNCIDLVRI
jgi:hypothetical protein